MMKSIQSLSAATNEKENTEFEETPVHTRLVVCVDGTWTSPDGTHGALNGNVSNVFRIWCSIKEGKVTSNDGTLWRQERTYFRGIGSLDTWHGNLLSGVYGSGVEQQIKEVYKACCTHTKDAEDEIFFFGFSRGAFVVRAVANLLAYMRAPRDLNDFDEFYKQTLDLYQDVREGNAQRQGSIYEHMTKCRPSPKLQFIGVIDTVQAFEDEGLYDICLQSCLRHCRHALALNETKVAFIPLLWEVSAKTAQYELRKASSEHSILEGWFLGSHGDLGGARTQDGAALYPLQWLLSEAADLNLVLDFTEITYASSTSQKQVAVRNPLQLIFPNDSDMLVEVPAAPHVVSTANGIRVKMWDLRDTHRLDGFSISIKHQSGSWLFPSDSRHIFEQSRLIGYHRAAPLGVFIHPSAYLIYDRMPNIATNARKWGFHDRFCKFREIAVPSDVERFWNEADEEQLPQVDKIRILICGNAGAGKSTIINLLLGSVDATPESSQQHGVHDINREISPDGAKYILHDSCGFQAGQNEEIERVKEFLQKRSTAAVLAERLHIILYCVPLTRLRVTESCDDDFFNTLKQCDSAVPVVLVGTRSDELEALCADQVEKIYMTEQGKQSRRMFCAEDWDEIESRVKTAYDERTNCFVKGIASRGHNFAGPAFTSKDSPASIARLVTTITNNLTNYKIRLMFIAAQICTVQPKIDHALAKSITLYRRAIRTATIPIAFAGLAATTTVTGLIVRDVLQAFDYRSFSIDIASHTISTALLSNYEANSIYIAGNVLATAAAATLHTGVGAIALGAGAYGLKLAAVPQFGRLLLMCTVDTILVMERVFWVCSRGRAATKDDVSVACAAYNERSIEDVHRDIKDLLPVYGIWQAFSFTHLQAELARIVEKHRYQDASG